jgi:endonuclease/exonuclease/phosphatase (EEP) superfamily protein YafD
VIAGDFNDIPESSSIQKINQSFQDTWHETGHDSGFTFPSQAPERRIDYIFYRNPSDRYFHLKPVKSTIPKSPASDHLPLVVVFKILPYPQKIPS